MAGRPAAGSKPLVSALAQSRERSPGEGLRNLKQFRDHPAPPANLPRARLPRFDVVFYR